MWLALFCLLSYNTTAMGLFGKNEGGMMDVIRCDEQDYLMWKWRPAGQTANSTKKENSIRWGSSLRVKDGEIAIFVYRQKSGPLQDVIVGPYDEILKTDNLPVLTGLLGAAYNGGSPFQAEVYFINTAQVIQIPFAVPFFDVYDPRFHDFACPVAVRGRMTFNIHDYKQFIALHRLTDFTLEQFSEQVTPGVKKYAKSFISNAPAKYGFPVIQIERFIVELSEAMKNALADEMVTDFGANLVRVDLSAIDCDKDSEEYKKLYKLTGRQKTKQVVFATDLGMAKQVVSDFDDLGDQRKRRKIERKAIEKRGQLSAEQDNIEAHIVDKRSGGVLGWLGIGKKRSMEEVEGDLSMAKSARSGREVEFYYSVDGEQKGPFSVQSIIEMTRAGIIPKEAYFWKDGMEEWKHANDIPELSSLFGPATPPPPPKA